MPEGPFALAAHVYDALYEAAGRSYESEADHLHSLIEERRPGARSLLDVACGTGGHLLHLSRYYEVAGVDYEPAMLAEARNRLPSITLVEANMRSFELGRPFDVVICLFSSIGYMHSTDDLDRAVATMATHLLPGGVLIVDGWVRCQSWIDPGTVQALAATSGGMAVTRVVRSSRAGAHTTLELHHLVGTVDGVDYLVETHQLTLFRDDEYRLAFERAGLTLTVEDSPYPGRDRYIAAKPNSAR
jgi:SAM-dependent methyltransferase